MPAVSRYDYNKMNREEWEQLKEDAKIEFLGEQLTQEIYRINKFIRLVESICERVESLEARYRMGNKGRLFELENEVTYLHNEVIDIEKLLGMLGWIPKIKPKSKYEYH